MLKWKKISHKTIINHKLFKLQLHKVQLPNKKIIDNYFFVDANNGAMIIALTNDNKIILLEHYKYAVNEVVITLPGGLADNKRENIKKVALRELKEESGFVPEKIEFLGELMPLPGNITQRTSVFLATGCRKISDLDLDEAETLKVKIIDLEGLSKLLKYNQIKDSLAVAAIFMAKDYLML